MPPPQPTILFPFRGVTPVRALLRRIGLALGIVLFVAVATWVGRDSYRDTDGGALSFLDALYYSTVTVTTTGYGDIAPVSPGARAWTAFVVTPLRVLFLIVLVGTTLELLTERFRQARAANRWRRRVKNHVIVVGYGIKGRGATDSLLASGTPADAIVAIDVSPEAVRQARARGLTAVVGDATRTSVLREAMVERAASIVITCHRDDTATLVALTAHELNPDATIVSAVKEAENAHLLRESGARAVVVSSEAAGRLLGLAISEPCAVDVLEDLLVAGRGLKLVERRVGPAEVGTPMRGGPGQLPVALVRNGERIPFHDERCASLQHGDVVVALESE